MEHRHLLTVAALFAAAMSFAPPSAANDSWVEGVGGSVRPMSGPSTIRMVSEDIRVKLPRRTVEARFLFRNEGPATTVLIGFPETQNSEDPATTYTSFKSFASFVDGRRVAVQRRIQSNNVNFFLNTWWVKRVSFARNQTRTILNRYQGGEEGDVTGPVAFTYVLTTGAPWKGSIGRARITVDISGLTKNGPLEISPAGYARKGKRVIWDFRNLEPKRDIQIWWFPAFTNIVVNGRPAAPSLEHLANDLPLWSTPSPVRHGGTVFASNNLIAHLLGAKTKIDGSGRTVRIARGGRWVEATCGSAILKCSSGRQRMLWTAKPAYQGMSMSLRPVVRALGGRIDYVPSSHTIRINMPPATS